MSSPHHTTAAAIKGIAEKVAERLGKSGTTVYNMGEYPEKDRYTRFLAFYYAIAAENFWQADILFRDFETRRNALEPGRKCKETSERQALGTLSERVGDLMKSHFDGKADHEKLAAVAEVEEVCRQLSAAILRKNRNGMGPAEINRVVDTCSG